MCVCGGGGVGGGGGKEEGEGEERRRRAKEGVKGRKGDTETLTVHQACLWMLQVHLHPRAEQRKSL